MSINPSPVDVLEQYKVLVEDSARFSDRRQTTNNTYIAANVPVLIGIGYILTQSSLNSLLAIAITVIVAATGFAVCSAWRRIILNFRDLLNLRFNMLRHIEGLEQFHAPVNIYQLESYVLYGDIPSERVSQHVRDFAITPEVMEAAAKLDRDITAARAAKNRRQAKGNQRLFDFSLQEAAIPRLFQLIYVLTALVPIVAAVYSANRAAVAQFAAMFGITLPR